MSSLSCETCLPLELDDYQPLTLGKVRWMYKSGSISRDDALSFYPQWVDTSCYVVQYAPNRDKARGIDSRGRTCYYDHDYRAMKLSKRGNDVYRWKVRQKFRSLSQLCDIARGHQFLSGRTGESNFLFVTLTYDKNRCSEDYAWRNVGKELNLFFSKLKQEYGKFYVLRCFESFKAGYPHVHLLIGFETASFRVKRHIHRDGKPHYRLRNSALKKISGYWHSYIQAEGVKSLGAVGYILKYIQKDLYVTDGYNTVSKLWFYHKRSYDVSSGFEDWISTSVEVVIAAESRQLDSITSYSNNVYRDWAYLTVVNGTKTHDDWIFYILEDPPWNKEGFADEQTEVRRAFKEVI